MKIVDLALLAVLAVLAVPAYGQSPSIPLLLGTYSDTFVAKRVALSGTTALVAGSDRGNTQAILKFIDISNPATPTQSGSLIEAHQAFRDVAASGTVAAVSYGTSEIEIIDVTTKTVLSTLAITGATNTGLALLGTRLYVAAGPVGLAVVDVATPGAPVLLGKGAFTGGSGVDVFVSLPYAYVLDSSGWLRVVDVSVTPPVNKAGRQITGRGIFLSYTEGVVGIISRTSTDDSLELWNVSNPLVPSRYVITPVDATGKVGGLFLSPGRAYVGNTAAGVRLYDINNPTAPINVATGKTPGLAYDAQAIGSLVFVSGFPSALSSFRF